MFAAPLEVKVCVEFAVTTLDFGVVQIFELDEDVDDHVRGEEDVDYQADDANGQLDPISCALVTFLILEHHKAA